MFQNNIFLKYENPTTRSFHYDDDDNDGNED